VPIGIDLGVGIGIAGSGGAPAFWRSLLAYSPLLMLVAGEECYTDAAKTVRAGDTDAVYTWGDLSGNGFDAVQSTGAQRALLSIAGGPGGLPALDFDGASHRYDDLSSITGGTTDGTLVAVFIADDATTTQTLFAPNGASRFAACTATSDAIGTYDGTAWRECMPCQTGAQVVAWRNDATGTAVECYRDGVKLGEDTYDGDMAAWTAGATVGGLSASQFFNGKLACLLYFESKLSDSDLAAVHAILMSQYGRAFDYDSVANLSVAYKSDSGTTGDPVSAWAKALGTGDDFVQATEADKPDLGTIGSRQALVFPGSSENLDYSGAAADWNVVHNGTGGTLMISIEPDDTAAVGEAVGNIANLSTQVGFAILQNGAALRLRVANGLGAWLVDDTAAGVFTSNTLSTITVRTKTGATDEFDSRADSVQVGNGAFVGAASAADASRAVNLGSRTGSSLFADGNVGDVVLYSRYLNDYEAAAIEAHATARFS
jgi:hypothetical protein